MVFAFILNPSFVDSTFQIKHVMIGHVLSGGLFIWIDSSRAFILSSNLDGSNGLLLLANFLFSLRPRRLGVI